jgi:hypothetical protein
LHFLTSTLTIILDQSSNAIMGHIVYTQRNKL